MQSKFWIVISENNGPSGNPFRHVLEESAFQEAARLCRMHGGRFLVFETKGYAERTDIQIKRYSEEPPF